MERKLVLTKDGSHSVSIPEWDVFYHSVHGAIQESMHVFINTGLLGSDRLKRSDPSRLHIFEMGFGTGLNALLTLIELSKNPIPVYYETVDLYPLAEPEWQSLNYCEALQRPDLQPVFEQLHRSEWEKEIQINTAFTLFKKKADLLHFQTDQQFDLVYFDAFAPRAQAGLWTQEVFEKLYNLMNPGADLVTYCSKSIVRRAMQAAGFTVTKPPGPWGKREMLRAVKK